MQDSKFKEASQLEGRITLLEHIESLLHSSISNMPRHELRAHVSAIANEGLTIPTDLRLKIFECYSDVTFGDVFEIADVESEDFRKALEKYLISTCVFIPPPDSFTANDLNPTVEFLWAGAKEEVQYAKRFKSMSEEDADTFLQEKGEADVIQSSVCMNANPRVTV